MVEVLRRLTVSLLLAALPACEAGLPAKKLLVIGLDGVRVDVLAAAHTPHLDSLNAEGTISHSAQTRPPTVSGPGWSSMLTGVWMAGQSGFATSTEPKCRASRLN